MGKGKCIDVIETSSSSAEAENLEDSDHLDLGLSLSGDGMGSFTQPDERSRRTSTSSSGGKPAAMKTMMMGIGDNFAVPSPPSSSISGKSTGKRGRKRRPSDDFPPSPISSTISSATNKSESESVASTSSGKKKGRGKRTKKLKVKVVSITNTESSESVGQIEEDEYIVERIVGKKFIDMEDGKTLHYHIKWKGWANAHNTWEPKENLNGCQDLVDTFEEEFNNRKARKDLGSDVSDDDKENMEEEESQMARTRKELIEYGIETKWPTYLIPLELIGVVTVDKHLCYIVKHQTHDNMAILCSENCIVVRSNSFKKLFPHIVIAFYENCVLWVNRPVDDNLDSRADKALQMKQIVPEADANVKEEHVEEPEEAMNVDHIDDLDDSGLPIPKISIKKDVDLFGLPGDIHEDTLSSSDSEEEDQFEEIRPPAPQAKN